VSSSSKDPEQGEKKSSFFSSGSSSAKKSDAERGAVTAGEEGDGMAVQITDIYSEPIHSLAQQQRPLLAKVAAGQSAGSDVEVSGICRVQMCAGYFDTVILGERIVHAWNETVRK
jgi:hypothetical protein